MLSVEAGSCRKLYSMGVAGRRKLDCGRSRHRTRNAMSKRLADPRKINNAPPHGVLPVPDRPALHTDVGRKSEGSRAERRALM